MTVPILIDFAHGLGDAIQLTSLLLQLRHYHPEWEIDVAAAIGKHSAYRGLCRRVFIRNHEPIDRSAYAHVFELGWHECPTSYANHPSTRAEQCLIDVFGLAPVAELCRYQIEVSAPARLAAQRYLETICPMGPTSDGRWPTVLIHYQGNTSTDKKDLSHELIRAVCDEIIAAGFVPVILDWDRRSPLPDGVSIHNPATDHPLWDATGTGDAEKLAALIGVASLSVAIDSGPLHVAAATDTPTIAVWTRHPPLHYIGPAPNVLHLVPDGHEALLRGDRAAGLRYFSENYHHVVYRDLASDLVYQVCQHLPAEPDGLVYRRGFWVRCDNTPQDLVIVDDVAARDCYRIGDMRLPGPVFVDVGAHIGVASASFHARYPSARIVAVECCPENMPALKRNVGRFATIVQAALSYDDEVALLNAVFPNCASTGGSRVVPLAELASGGRQPPVLPPVLPATDLGPNPVAESASPVAEFARIQGRKGSSPNCCESGYGADAPPTIVDQYWADTRPLRTITLEGLMAQHGLDWIDVLKLDCEGCELELLDQCPVLDHVGLIAGEYHGRARFLALVGELLPGWKLEILRDGDPGTFWLVNPVAEFARIQAGKGDRRQASGVGREDGAVATGALRIQGRLVELTAQHALRFEAAGGALVPSLHFRGREVTQPWSLELSAVAEFARIQAVDRTTTARTLASPATGHAIQNRTPCRHLGAENGLRECATCRGHVRVKTFACSHPAHVETTLAECAACPDHVEREQVTGYREQKSDAIAN